MTIRYIHKRVQIWVRYRFMSALKLLVSRNRKLDSDTKFDQVSILFLSQNRIGDTLIATPIFAALKQAYPNCTIDVLLSKRNAQTLLDNPRIRYCHVIKKKPFDLFGVILKVRRQHYDFIVDLVPSKSATSTVFCLLGNAQYTVGLNRDNDFAYDIKVEPLIGNLNGDQSIRMVENVAQLLRPFRIAPNLKTLKTEYYLQAGDMEFAQQVVDKFITTGRINGNSAIIGINISASKRPKFWGIENFLEIINSIRNTFPAAIIVVLYSSAYRLEAEEISNRGSVMLCDETRSLSEFAAVISKLDILITPDSASVHLADIYKVPLVILTSEPLDQQYWFPIRSDFEILHAPSHQPICFIPVIEVETAFLKLAQRTKLDKSQVT